MNNDLRARIRRQLDIEDESRALGAKRYQSRELPWKFEAGTAEEEANLPPGKKLLKAAIQPTADAIRAFIDGACSGKAGRRHSAADLLLLLDPMEAAYITCRVLVNCSVGKVQLQRAAVLIAEALDEHLSMSAFKGINKQGYKGFMKQQEQRGYSRQRKAAVKKLLTEEGALVDSSTSEKVTKGNKLIELAIEATGLWSLERVARSRGWLDQATGQNIAAVYLGLERYSTKSDKPREVPATDRVLRTIPLLNSMAVKGRWFPWQSGSSGPGYMLANLKTDMESRGFDISDVTMHTMRHSCATRLAIGGMDLVALRDWLGHSDIQITAERYIHLMSSHLYRGAAILNLAGTSPHPTGIEPSESEPSSMADIPASGRDRADAGTPALH